MNKPDPVARAKAGWGHAVPEWVMGLAKACAATSQNKVALRMGISAAVVSNTLACKYTGDMKRVEDLYRGVFESCTAPCPVLGEVQLDVCRNWRKKAGELNAANGRNVMMFRACNKCPVYLAAEGGRDV